MSNRMKGVAMLFGIELGEVFHIRNAKCAINDDFKFTDIRKDTYGND